MWITMARLGRDAETKYTPNGKAVTQLAMAVDYGQKGPDGKRPTQWIDAALFGDRGEKLAQYLTKGAMVNVALRDAHVETYAKKDGTQGVALRAIVADVLWFSSARNAEAAPAERPAPRASARAAAPAAGASDGFSDSDIPFAPLHHRRALRWG